MFVFAGIVRDSSTGTIGGGIVFGVSTIFSVILALVFICCLKNNDVNTNTNNERSSANPHQYEQQRHREHNRQVRPEKIVSS